MPETDDARAAPASTLHKVTNLGTRLLQVRCQDGSSYYLTPGRSFTGHVIGVHGDKRTRWSIEAMDA